MPRSVFSQLVLVIALVLAGTLAIAIVLSRVLVSEPAGAQLLRAMQGFADVAEEVARSESNERAMQVLRDGGLEVRMDAPAQARPRFAPLLRALQEQAPQQLSPGRELRISRDSGRSVAWLRLDTTPAIWVSFPVDRRDHRVRRFSIGLLLGCTLLVWLAAAHFARRLVIPLRRLAHAAPDFVRGESPPLDTSSGPREVAELARALDRASTEAREAAEERTLMLAGISHDLRTPLTRLQFALALLPDADPELRAGMDRDIGEIDAILSQFIAYARDGRDEAMESLDLSALCRQAVSAMPDGWASTLPEQAPLRGRPLALMRALENLLGNAQRHGAPPFSLQLERDGANWRVEVADHGPGIDTANATRMRQPFVHGGEGTGLGLAIVERVARQHGGELQLASNAPRGLRATLVLRADGMAEAGMGAGR